MKKHLWDIASYAVIFGMVYYQSSHDSDWMLMGFVTVFLVGCVQVVWTILSMLGHAGMWGWDATVNFRKGNND